MALVLAALMALALLTGCGNSQTPAQSSAGSSPAAQQAEGSAEAPAAEESAAEASAAVSEAAASEQAAVSASPYAWLGLQDMPSCPYLDALCTYHYYREYTSYVMGLSTKSTEAVDGANSFKGTETTRIYSVDGRIVSFNDSSKIYSEQELGSSLVEMSAANIEKNKANGTSMVGRAFVTKGTGVIPEYSDTEGDQTEYEYYEYNYLAYEKQNYQLVDRFYMKDGDVFAFYQETYSDGKLVAGLTEVIHSMSTEIPEGTFDIPSTEGYEKV